MRTLTPPVLEQFEQRFRNLTPQHAAEWGAMTAHQMVLHVGDATAAVLKHRPFPQRAAPPSRIAKLIVLRVLRRFPRGVRTRADPAAVVTDGREFESDKVRTLGFLRELVASPVHKLEISHPVFGPMSQRDWLRWAYLHTDHHLRQFGA
jgi:hypothetical protein